MSRKKRTTHALDRARATAAQIKPVAGQIRPVAETTRAAAGRQLRRTRAWAAPRVERTGQVLQDRVAPKLASMLSTAAQRIEPDQRTGRRWRVAAAAGLTAAASAAAAVLGRRRLGQDVQAGEAAADAGTAAGGPTASPNGQAGASEKAAEETRTS